MYDTCALIRGKLKCGLGVRRSPVSLKRLSHNNPEPDLQAFVAREPEEKVNASELPLRECSDRHLQNHYYMFHRVHHLHHAVGRRTGEPVDQETLNTTHVTGIVAVVVVGDMGDTVSMKI